MKYLPVVVTTVMLVFLLSLIGCKSKQENTGTGAGAPQGQAVAPVASPQDKADAQAAAVRLIALFEAGDFPAIYKDAAEEFKQIGSESQFVSKFQETRKKVGVLKNPQQISFGTLPGNGYVLVYRVENERYKTDLRLTFARSANGKMELAGLNQHDELKK
jgi:hypothetical protein